MENLIDYKPIKKDILVMIYDDGQNYKNINGFKLWMPSDDRFGKDSLKRNVNETKHTGIRPRFACVLSVAPYAVESGLKPGDKVLLDTMKWSRGVTIDHKNNDIRVWRISADDVLYIDDDGFDEDEMEKINSMMGAKIEQSMV